MDISIIIIVAIVTGGVLCSIVLACKFCIFDQRKDNEGYESNDVETGRNGLTRHGVCENYSRHQTSKTTSDGREEEAFKRAQELQNAVRKYHARQTNHPVQESQDKMKADSSEGLKAIVIDGQNVGIGHALDRAKFLGQEEAYVDGKNNRKILSTRGIELCIEYFQNRGHKNIKVILPSYRFQPNKSDNHVFLQKLENKGIAIRIPPGSHDDNWILQTAVNSDAVIISNDKYRKERESFPQFRDVIDNRLLKHVWIGPETIEFPLDPRGSDKFTSKPNITLDDFLKA